MDEPGMNEQDDSDHLELCAGNADEREKAFNRFMQRNGQTLYGAIARDLNRRGVPGDVLDSADKILQETRIQLFKRAEQGELDNVTSLLAYTYGIAKNVTKNFLRKEVRRKILPAPDEDFWETSEKALAKMGVDPLEYGELSKALFECINQLPDLQKKYIYARADDPYDPLKPAELACIYKVSPGSVSSRLFEARQAIEECMKRKKLDIPRSRAKGE